MDFCVIFVFTHALLKLEESGAERDLNRVDFLSL